MSCWVGMPRQNGGVDLVILMENKGVLVNGSNEFDDAASY